MSINNVLRELEQGDLLLSFKKERYAVLDIGLLVKLDTYDTFNPKDIISVIKVIVRNDKVYKKRNNFNRNFK